MTRKPSCSKCAWQTIDGCSRRQSSVGCSYFIALTDIKRIAEVYKNACHPTYDGRWLTSNPSASYLIALGAGPWKENRRFTVQKAALTWYGDLREKYGNITDISDIPVHELETKVYPFQWQNDHLKHMILSFQNQPQPPIIYKNPEGQPICACEQVSSRGCRAHMSMETQNFTSYCQDLKTSYQYTEEHPWLWRKAVANVFARAQVPAKGTKVLWLWIRDFLNLPAFPIDRWVKRNLDAYALPADSWYLTQACLLAGVDPNPLARSFFTARNPEWSEVDI